MTVGRRFVTLAGSVLALAPVVHAQRPPRPATSSAATAPGRDTLRARLAGDSLRGRGDTLSAADTATRPNLVEPDSTMRRLLALPGYSARVYQAEQLTYDATSRGLCLANRATVASGDTLLLKSQSICSAGAGNRIRVGSDTAKGRNIISLPGQKPIYSSGVGIYDVAGRRAIVTEVRTSLEQSGQTLQIKGDRVVAVLPPRDSSAGTPGAPMTSKDATFYLRDGTITACTDTVPDYFFKAGEIKRTGSFVVARPAVLYIGDVPVMWLPFLFQDVRGGRHSGILTPSVGVSDIVRNSPSYRRTVDGLGYYVAISDYLDAQASLDWRSSAGQTDFNGDQGFMKYNGELRYNWLERYLGGNIAVSRTTQGTSTNKAVSVQHHQEFSRNANLTANYNYVTNTFLQRQTTLNPMQISASIHSSAAYNQKLGPFTMALGGSQSQYPGRSQLERTFPSLSLNTSPIDFGSWLVWTPALSYTSTQTLRIDQPSPLSVFFQPGRTTSGDTILADTLRRNAYRSNLSVGTPLQIFGYQIGNQFSVNSERNEFPQLELVTGVLDGVVTPRIYATTYSTSLDWTPSFTLPALGRNNLNLSPNLSFQNIDPSAFAVRNQRTSGEWVHQAKRPTFGLSATPTLFGLFGGFGPYSRIRHSVTPSVSYSYAPKRDVSNQFLAAIGQTKFSRSTGDTTGYLGGLAQNAVSFQLSTNFEAKTRSKNDSNPEAGDKVKLLSVNFSSLTYDFERARATHRPIRGLTTDGFSYTVRSDLLPGFDLGVRYSLFEGSTLTDSAKFDPFREGVTANFSFSNTANPFAVITRLFGLAVDESQPDASHATPPPDDRYARQVASQPVAGRAASRAAFLPTTTAGWQASFQFTAQRHRPVSGANVVQFDPSARCLAQFPGARLRLIYEQCVIQARANPTTESALNSGLPGSTVFSYPNVVGLGTNLSFNLTEHWAATYNTNYDFVLRNFATQVVSLQRDLHDWRAIFGFTQGANGAFAFNFLVSLKAEPELKFDYHKSTYRGSSY